MRSIRRPSSRAIDVVWAAVLLLILGSGCRTTAAPGGMQKSPGSEEVTFRNGDVTLSGTLYLPARSGPVPAIVAFHSASGGTRDYEGYQHLARRLPAIGVAVLLFDRRGSGKSGGEMRTTTFADLAADGIAGLESLKTRSDIDSRRLGVWGVSQGAWVASLAATMSSDIRYVACVSFSAVTPANQMDYAARYALRSAGNSAAVIDEALRTRTRVNEYYRGREDKESVERMVAAERSQKWFDLMMLPNSGNIPNDARQTKWYREMDYDPLTPIRRLTVPCIFFYAGDDPWVPVEESMAKVLEAAAGHARVTILRIPHTGHLMEVRPDSPGQTSREYQDQLVKWVRDVTAP